MSWDSILNDRIAEWSDACLAWDFAIQPAFSEEVVSELHGGYFALHAERDVMIDRERVTVTVTVTEAWSELPHPVDSRLSRHGGSVQTLNWHAQVGASTEAMGAERLEVVEEPDATHPRIHRHPYGQPNDVRCPDEFRHADEFLHRLNAALAGALDAPPPT